MILVIVLQFILQKSVEIHTIFVLALFILVLRRCRRNHLVRNTPSATTVGDNRYFVIIRLRIVALRLEILFSIVNHQNEARIASILFAISLSVKDRGSDELYIITRCHNEYWIRYIRNLFRYAQSVQVSTTVCIIGDQFREDKKEYMDSDQDHRKNARVQSQSPHHPHSNHLKNPHPRGDPQPKPKRCEPIDSLHGTSERNNFAAKPSESSSAIHLSV